MDNYVILYYCYKNASPIDIFHNPIPSICSLRQLNKEIPIVVMSCNDNEHMFQPYQLSLNFHFHKFTARSEKYQLAYKAIDAYEYMIGANLDGVVMCDIDIMWHTNIEEIITEWKLNHSDQHAMFQFGLNTGLFGLRKGIDWKYMQTWFGLCNLFAQTGQNDITDYVLKANYSSGDLHDESTLGVVRRMLGRRNKKIWWYPNHYCYCPAIEYAKVTTNVNTVRSWHYMMGFLKQFFQYKYGHEWMLSHIGRTGFFLSIEEYRAMMENQLKENFYKFANHFGVAPKSEKVINIMRHMQHFYRYELAPKKKVAYYDLTDDKNRG
jgi:hypothetical protein